MKHIKIGTRGSKLALWQANYVASALLSRGWNTQIVTIDTRGDQQLDVSISKIGSKGVFTEEIEDCLRSGDIDIAVHSAKDMQSTLPDDLEIIAFTEREIPNDVLVAKKSVDLSKPIRIGTSSTRRVAMLKHYYPHLEIVPMRGNLQTRFKKLEEGQCDALMLAKAGVVRMGMQKYIVHEFPLDTFTPPVGQGVVAIEAKKDVLKTIRDICREAINHAPSEICLTAERSFLKILEGGCSIPAFAHAVLDGQKVKISAGLLSLDGTKIIRKSGVSEWSNSGDLGRATAEDLLTNGGAEMLEQIKREIK